MADENVKRATQRRRERKARLLAGRAVKNPNHGNAYWARNWGCECLPCKQAVSKLNREEYLARKARDNKRTN